MSFTEEDTSEIESSSYKIEEYGDCQVTKSVFIGDIDSLLIPGSAGEEDDFSGNYKFYDVDCERVMLVMRHPAKLHYYGCFTVFSLFGRAELCGYVLEPSQPPIQVYSSKGYAALYLSTVNTPDEDEPDISFICNFGIPLMESTKIYNCVKEGGCILLLSEAEQTLITEPRVVRKEPRHRPEERLGLRVDRPGRRIGHKLTLPPELETVGVPACTVLCGGSGAGKSTSLRYLLNSMLKESAAGRVLYIDLDIGQPEFTLHECVSAVSVEEPLLGPPFSHFRRPLLSFHVGDIDASRCVDTYLRAVQLLVEECDRLIGADVPRLVNTMGFCRGVGIYLTCSVIKLLCPSLVIQIKSSTTKNFPAPLSQDYVIKATSSTPPIPSYRLLVLTKPLTLNVKDSSSSFLTNRQIRWISTESYFSSCVRPSYPLVCPSSLVGVFCTKTQQKIPSHHYPNLTGKIIIISSSNSVVEPPMVLDYGVILAYVESEEIFLLLTPLEPCNNIRSLLLGSLQIHDQLQKTISLSTSGLIPFTHIGRSSAPTIKPIKRQYRFLFENKATTSLPPQTIT